MTTSLLQFQSGWRRRHRTLGWMTLGAALLLAAAAISTWGTTLWPRGATAAFQAQYLAVVVAMVAWMMAVGKAFNGRVDGLLIDGRNRVSLSRLQLFVWLVIVGCAFAVEVAHNFQISAANLQALKLADPAGLRVSPELGLVMGMATTSFVATPAILSLKARRTPSALELATARRFAHDDQSVLHPRSGRLYSRRLGDSAHWSDLFRGEELGNFSSADPAKVQQFLVTAMLATIYVAQVWRDLALSDAAQPFLTLPDVGQGGLILLGVSHSAYLGAKAAPQTAGGPGIPRVDTAPPVSDKPPPGEV